MYEAGGVGGDQQEMSWFKESIKNEYSVSLYPTEWNSKFWAFLFPSVTPNPASGSHWSDLYYYILQVLSVLKLHVKGILYYAVFVSGIVYLTWYLWDSSVLLQVSEVHFYYWITVLCVNMPQSCLFIG